MATPGDARQTLLRRGFALEYLTLGWNAVGIVVLGFAAIVAKSVALAGFGFDSLIEIGASTVVIWELSGTGADRQRRALRLIGAAFAALVFHTMLYADFLEDPVTWVLLGVGVALAAAPRARARVNPAPVEPANRAEAIAQ